MVAPLTDEFNVNLTPDQKKVLFRDFIATRSELFKKTIRMFGSGSDPFQNWRRVGGELMKVPALNKIFNNPFLDDIASETAIGPQRADLFIKRIQKNENVTVYLVCLAANSAGLVAWSEDTISELAKVDPKQIMPAAIEPFSDESLLQKLVRDQAVEIAALREENNRLQMEKRQLEQHLSNMQLEMTRMMSSRSTH